MYYCKYSTVGLVSLNSEDQQLMKTSWSASRFIAEGDRPVTELSLMLLHPQKWGRLHLE